MPMIDSRPLGPVEPGLPQTAPTIPPLETPQAFGEGRRHCPVEGHRTVQPFLASGQSGASPSWCRWSGESGHSEN